MYPIYLEKGIQEMYKFKLGCPINCNTKILKLKLFLYLSVKIFKSYYVSVPSVTLTMRLGKTA
jgi:hypothetical protein